MIVQAGTTPLHVSSPLHLRVVLTVGVSIRVCNGLSEVICPFFTK